MPVARHHEHSFDIDLIARGEWVLDVGCRGFALPLDLCAHGANVLAVDADPSVRPPTGIRWSAGVEPGLLRFVHAAVMEQEIAVNRKETTLHLHPTDQQAHTVIRPRGGQSIRVPTASLNGLRAMVPGLEQFALLKLDCEGAEYRLMLECAWHAKCGKPIARQISVEYHDHCGLNPDPDMERWYRNRLHPALSEFYEITKHVREVPPWGGSPHYVDSLYTLKREFWR